MSDDRPAGETGGRGLAYNELGEMLGVSPEAARAVARRHKWPRQSANAVGRVVRVLVPADRIRTAAANEHKKGGQRPDPDSVNRQDSSGQWSSPVGYMQSYSLRVVANGHDPGGRVRTGPSAGIPVATGRIRMHPDATSGQSCEESLKL